MTDKLNELERLRHKRMAEMMKRIEVQKKKEELKKDKPGKTDEFLKNIMLFDAYQYYKEQIAAQRPLIANRIVEVLQYLIKSGVLQMKLTKEQLIIIDRKLSGVGPNIRIKRSGKEYTDIATVFKKKE
ncbi:MAG: DNA-binding protein [Promethearchaeota archaeon]